jgi:hypothetical protein
MTARLEGRLLEVVNAVNNARDGITGAVRSVENAVGRMRTNNTPNIVQG